MFIKFEILADFDHFIVGSEMRLPDPCADIESQGIFRKNPRRSSSGIQSSDSDRAQIRKQMSRSA